MQSSLPNFQIHTLRRSSNAYRVLESFSIANLSSSSSQFPQCQTWGSSSAEDDKWVRWTRCGTVPFRWTIRAVKLGLGADKCGEGNYSYANNMQLLTTKEARRRQQMYDELALGGQVSPALLVVREHLPSGNSCL